MSSALSTPPRVSAPRRARASRRRASSVRPAATAKKPATTTTRDRSVVVDTSSSSSETTTTATTNPVAAALAALVLATSPAPASLASLAAFAGGGLAVGLLSHPAPAEAALSNPNTRLPRNGVSALRRAVPAVNPEAGDVQRNLEEAAYLLRIPQRKPWGTMEGDVRASLAIVREKRAKLLEPVPKDGDAFKTAEDTLAELEQLFVELGPIAASQDVERFDRGVAMALDATSRLRVLQAPGLPFDVPRRYDALPRLTGRATVDLTIKKAGDGTFGFVNGDEVKTATLRVVADGYNAPLTAGNFVNKVYNGFYDDVKLKKSETATLVDVTNALADDTLPLEVKAMDFYEPRWRSALNVQGGEEMPTLPLSVNGSIAMVRGEEDGTSSPDQWFIYQFDKRSAGLGGMAFEEGEFSVFGYVVGGEEEGFLSQLATGDVIVKADVVEGMDRLVNGSRRTQVTGLIDKSAPPFGASDDVPAAAASSVKFVGKYADPKHPGCKREVSGSGDTLDVTGTDGAPGCLNGEPQRPWALTGVVRSEDEIFIDFSPKGGPRDLLGKWTGKGILFPDGNEWKKIE